MDGRADGAYERGDAGHRDDASLPLAVLPSARLAALGLRQDTRYLRTTARRVLNAPESTRMPFWSINPYIGCEFGCSYCYARDTHRWAVQRAAEAGQLDDDPGWTELPADELFERRILVKRDAADVLRRTLEPARVGDAEIVIGTATDPYQPAERRLGVTRSVLEALLGWRGLRLGIISKSPLIARDTELLQALAAQHALRIHVSLITADPRLARRLERRTALPQARLRALERLARAGLDVGLLVAPVVPLLTDSRAALERLFAAARRAGARRIYAVPLRLGAAARRRFLPHLLAEFPGLAERYRRHFGAHPATDPRYQDALRERVEALQRRYGFPVRARFEEGGSAEATGEEEQLGLF